MHVIEYIKDVEIECQNFFTLDLQVRALSFSRAHLDLDLVPHSRWLQIPGRRSLEGPREEEGQTSVGKLLICSLSRALCARMLRTNCKLQRVETNGHVLISKGRDTTWTWRGSDEIPSWPLYSLYA